MYWYPLLTHEMVGNAEVHLGCVFDSGVRGAQVNVFDSSAAARESTSQLAVCARRAAATAACAQIALVATYWHTIAGQKPAAQADRLHLVPRLAVLFATDAYAIQAAAVSDLYHAFPTTPPDLGLLVSEMASLRLNGMLAPKFAALWHGSHSDT